MPIAHSELILNPDGSIYHLNLKPEHIAETIITVGDQDRVDMITRYFDTIEYRLQKREFHTQTGTYKGKRITVISTGIGPDNIDIVFNELDALVNIDLDTREVKPEHTTLNIIRIGTSGGLQENIPIDSFVISEYAAGFDSLLHFYDCEEILDQEISKAFMKHLEWDKNKSIPYTVKYDKNLGDQLHSDTTIKGFTITNIGFYGPQGRVLRLPLQDPDLNDKIASFDYQHRKVTNMEMETAAMYGLAKLLGHRTVSMNAIIANRALGTFSQNPKKTVDNLIRYTLDKIVSL